MQNAIELKNKRSIWLKAQSETLSSGQNEVKFEFPLPITACNIVLEFAEFYTNMQVCGVGVGCGGSGVWSGCGVWGIGGVEWGWGVGDRGWGVGDRGCGVGVGCGGVGVWCGGVGVYILYTNVITTHLSTCHRPCLPPSSPSSPPAGQSGSAPLSSLWCICPCSSRSVWAVWGECLPVP